VISFFPELLVFLVGFEVPAVANIKSATFWDMAQCCPVDATAVSEDSYCLHRQGERYDMEKQTGS
jgi:hypothetical protein